MGVGGITVLNTAGISEVTFQQRPGGEGMTHVDIWANNRPHTAGFLNLGTINSLSHIIRFCRGGFHVQF